MKILSIWLDFGIVFFEIKVGILFGVLVFALNHVCSMGSNCKSVFSSCVPLLPTQNLSFPNVFNIFSTKQTLALHWFCIGINEIALVLHWFCIGINWKALVLHLFFIEVNEESIGCCSCALVSTNMHWFYYVFA